MRRERIGILTARTRNFLTNNVVYNTGKINRKEPAMRLDVDERVMAAMPISEKNTPGVAAPTPEAWTFSTRRDKTVQSVRTKVGSLTETSL